MGVDIMEQMKFIRRLPEPMEMKAGNSIEAGICRIEGEKR